MYKAPPYQAEIIKEEFEEHLLPKSTVQEQPKESENKRETESTREASEEEVITMHLVVQYENINGHRIMFIKKESGIHVLVVENGQEIEINGVKIKILY
jgi:FtsZ-interacting cell division protein ZipA